MSASPRRKREPLNSPEAAKILRELYEEARTVRGWTPLNDPARKTSEILSELLADLWEMGISVDSLDEAMGARPGVARHRMARHGYRPQSPSQKHYQGVHVDHAARRRDRPGTRLDITGQQFHQLTAVEPTGESSPLGMLWRFRCDCGSERVAAAAQVKAGKVRKCGDCSGARG